MTLTTAREDFTRQLLTRTGNRKEFALRLATVHSVGPEGTLEVLMGNDPTPLPARHLGSYDPVEGDPVQLFVWGADLLVLGSVKRGQAIPEFEDRDFEANPILESELADEAVRRRHIIDRAISTIKIAEEAINEELLANSAITETKISDDAVTTLKVRANSIIGDHIQTRQILAHHVVTGTITANEIAGLTITGDKISGETITADKMVVGTITAASGIIANAAIGTLQVQNGAITNAKINDLNASKITAGTISTLRLDTAAIAADTAFLNNLTVTDGHISSLNVNKLLGGTISAKEIILSNSASSIIRSSHLPGSNQGWFIRGNGTAEFNNLTIRNAAMVGGSITISGIIISNSGITLPAGTGNLNRMRWMNGATQDGSLHFTTLGTGFVSARQAMYVMSDNSDVVLSVGPSRTVHITSNLSSGELSVAMVWTRLSGGLQVQGHGTQTNAGANTNMTTAGTLTRFTSSDEFKEQIENVEEEYNKILDLRPVWFKCAAPADPDGWSSWGLIAEEVAQLDPRLVQYSDKEGEEGKPSGVNYHAISVLLQPYVKRHEEKIKQLEEQIKELQSS